MTTGDFSINGTKKLNDGMNDAWQKALQFRQALINNKKAQESGNVHFSPNSVFGGFGAGSSSTAAGRTNQSL